MPACSAYGCRNRNRPRKDSGKKMRMFRFPADSARRMVWEERVNRANWTPSRNAVLCQDHFEPDQFEANRRDGWRKLKQTAVPTIFTDQVIPKHRKLLRIPDQGEEVHQNIKAEGGLLPRERRFGPLPTPSTLLALDLSKQLEASVDHSYAKCSEVAVKQEGTDSGRSSPVNESESPECTSGSSAAPQASDHGSTSLDGSETVLIKKEQPKTTVKEEVVGGGSTYLPLEIKQEPPDDSIHSCSPPVPEDVEARDPMTEDVEGRDPVTEAGTGDSLVPSDIGFDMPLAVELTVPAFDLHHEQIAFLKAKIKDLRRQLRKEKSKQDTFNRNISRLFNPDQVAALARSNNNTRGQKWSTETLQKASQIRLLCGNNGYEGLLSKGFPLPSLRMLQRERKVSLAGKAVLQLHQDFDPNPSLTVDDKGVEDRDSDPPSSLEVDGEGLKDEGE